MENLTVTDLANLVGMLQLQFLNAQKEIEKLQASIMELQQDANKTDETDPSKEQ